MRLSNDTWQQINAGYAALIGLRELAHKMNVPEGTVLARAKREGWTQQIEAAKHAAALSQSNAITSLQSIAAVMHERGERYRERMADVSEKLLVIWNPWERMKFFRVVHKWKRSTLWHVVNSAWTSRR
jgi:NOL1/NOP2/fmu family ribosome biogenesis protein